MLDLLARHGRLDLDVAVTRRPRDGRASHRRGHRHRARPGARPRARATAPGSTATARRSCRWTRPAHSARSTSPDAPTCDCSRTCRPASPAASTTSCSRSSSARSPTTPSCTLHIEVQAAGNAHHMIEAAFKAFARALRAAVAIDPTEPGVPSHEGGVVGGARRDLHVIGLVDYGMGNRRSVEKALEHVGALRARQLGPRRARAGPGTGRAGCRRLPQGDGAPARARPRRLPDRARRRRRAAPRHLPRHAPVLRSLDRAGRIRRAGCRPRRGPRARGRRAEDAADRLERGPLGAQRAGARGARRGRGLLPRAQLRRGARRRRDVLGSAEYGERFASVVSHGSFLGVQFHPEKSSHDGLRLLANWVAGCERGGDPLPGDRHPRRPRRAPHPGRLRPAHRVRRRAA